MWSERRDWRTFRFSADFTNISDFTSRSFVFLFSLSSFPFAGRLFNVENFHFLFSRTHDHDLSEQDDLKTVSDNETLSSVFVGRKAMLFDVGKEEKFAHLPRITSRVVRVKKRQKKADRRKKM